MWQKGWIIIQYYPEAKEYEGKVGQPPKVLPVTGNTFSWLKLQQETGRKRDSLQNWVQLAKGIGESEEDFQRWANNIRTMLDMTLAYLRDQLPKAVKNRWERYSKMHPAETGYVEAAAKAGKLWEEIEGKKPDGGAYRSAISPTGISVIDAG